MHETHKSYEISLKNKYIAGNSKLTMETLEQCAKYVQS